MTNRQSRPPSRSPSRTAAAESPPSRRSLRLRLVLLISIVILGAVLVKALGLFETASTRKPAAQRITDSEAPLAQFFTPEVLYWQDDITRWAETYQINPNVIALLMQIESCGSPEVLSWVGAVGLMQVMPFYFDNGENMLDPDTNVYHGMRIFQECLNVFAGGDVGVAAACYNGGASVTQMASAYWPAETRAYYTWASGLWNDVVRGVDSSDSLDDWLESGGSRLCEIASQDLFVRVAVE